MIPLSYLFFYELILFGQSSIFFPFYKYNADVACIHKTQMNFITAQKFKDVEIYL